MTLRSVGTESVIQTVGTALSTLKPLSPQPLVRLMALCSWCYGNTMDLGPWF